MTGVKKQADRSMIMVKSIIPYIDVANENENSLIEKALAFENQGADELYISNFTNKEEDVEKFLLTTKKLIKTIDLPVTIGVYVKRFEDVKKAFYTGAKAVVMQYNTLIDPSVIKESIQRFGDQQIIVEVCNENDMNVVIESGVRYILCNQLEDQMKTILCNAKVNAYIRKEKINESDINDLKEDIVAGIILECAKDSINELKYDLKENGVVVNTFESKLSFDEFKTDDKGLIPAVVQDYKTNEVLMMAYMNKESFEQTIKTGRMTYWSRSRQELWIKGETSGHYQYVKELRLDCDHDTILAKVRQEGAACHTGNYSCFYTELMKKEYDDTNPYSVFEDVYNIIMDRKEHPKEGSYTNYLFDKGIDKILKKCGEEATEIVIAAKNPEVEELKYEISDFLYHCMVLMAERGVDWKDITKELAHRR